MRLGIISDAHGNYLAIRKCIDFLLSRELDRIVFLGDAVGYMPEAHEVVALLGEINAVCIRGNHEEMLFGRMPPSDTQEVVHRLRETRLRLNNKVLSEIERWDICYEIENEGNKLFFVHGSPRHYFSGLIYPDSDLSEFMGMDYQVVFLGHTHRPFMGYAGNVKVVNVGSCGLPRDVGNLASCVIYETGSGKTEIFRVPLPVGQILDRFGDAIHSSVIATFARRSDSFVGTLISEA